MSKFKLKKLKKTEQCFSIAPWPDDSNNPVRCQAERGHHLGHGGNGWTWDDVITLKGHLSGSEPPTVVCTCGWSYGPSADLMKLGMKAKNHALDMGHKFRSHNG